MWAHKEEWDVGICGRGVMSGSSRPSRLGRTQGQGTMRTCCSSACSTSMTQMMAHPHIRTHTNNDTPANMSRHTHKHGNMHMHCPLHTACQVLPPHSAHTSAAIW